VASSPHLCETFRHVAVSVFDDYQRGRAVGIVPWETSFTDFALLKIATAHAHEVLVHRFDGKSEAVTGADWEWWFCSRTGFTGLRVQAKRMEPTRNQFRVPKLVGGVQQAVLLVNDAAARGAHPFYCLYSDKIPIWPTPAATPGPCPHGPFDPRLWGTAVAHAEVVRMWLETARPRRPLLESSWPWHRIVCRHPSQTPDQGAQSFVTTAIAEALRRTTDEGRAAIWSRVVDRSPGEAPSDVRRAYEARDPSLIEPDERLQGVVLVTGDGDGDE